MTTTEPDPVVQGALADRLLGAVIGTFEVAAVELGVRLGWYRALAQAPATAPELAGRTGTEARYAREWLEQQAVAGYLAVDDVRAAPDARRYTLPEEHRRILVDEVDPLYMAPMPRLALAFTRNLEKLVEVYRGGRGLGWHEMGPDAWEGQAAVNRPFFLTALVPDVLATLPDVDAALRGGGRVADVGCGMGWSSVGIATGYPTARVDGYDVDVPSVEQAQRNALEAGVADRVRFHVVDVGDVAEDGAYDLALAFECVHDLPDPVAVLAAMRRMVRPGGTVLVADERVAEEFTAPGDEIERLMYGYSLFCCLPDGLSTRPSVGTGTVMRPATLERYARTAGFVGIEVLPVENDFFRFYRLRQE
ncbi:class I SAM-dependent methyltransferase [Geodermatophilus sp. SYSU D00815]